MTNEEPIATNSGRIFQCPHCKEYINDSMTTCRFCGQMVDLVGAQFAADARDRINRACSDGNFLQTVGRAVVVAYLLSWIPLIGMAGGWGFFFLMIAVPVMVLRWWIKYQSIQTDDPDYQQARGRVIVSAAIWGGMLVVWLIGSILYAVLMAKISSE